MRKLFVVILAAILLAGFALVNGVLARAGGGESTAVAQAVTADRGRPPDAQGNDGHGPEIMATNRISIPYGVEATLPLSTIGREILISGHGGCTENEEVTVELTVTQAATGATATGQTQQTCSGVLQQWQALATADTATAFDGGAAEVCGVATTRADGYVTDTFEWCRDVTLIWRSYLPLILRE